jgi:beta-glucanase (GH16 family)
MQPIIATAASRFGWQQRAGDEFDGNRLNLEKWRIYSGLGTNGVGFRTPEAVSVRNGSLIITASGNESGGLAWWAPPATMYGRWEFRARADYGPGYSAVVLLWPDSENWPGDGEIDVMEIPAGDRQSNVITLHYGEDDQRVTETVEGDFTRWHTYAVEWMPDHVTVFIDGHQALTTRNPAVIPRAPMHPAIQLDVGPQGYWVPAPGVTTPSQVEMWVDWVRIYQ